MGCLSSSRHRNTLSLTTFWCLGLPGEECHCLEFVVKKIGAHFQCTFSATFLLPKIRTIRSQLPVCFFFFSAVVLLCHDTEVLYSLSICRSQITTYFNKFPWSCSFIFYCLFHSFTFQTLSPFTVPFHKSYISSPASIAVFSHLTIHSCLNNLGHQAPQD